MDNSGRRRPRPSRPTNFWDSLDLAERADFRSRAVERTFANGARLMQEGESADHVIVILEGRTRICIDDGGTECIIAERGPGQLVGERAALEVSVRSATVIARDTVQALVMRTRDFAAFVSAHPDVLEIVSNQVYDRLTEGRLQHDDDPARLSHITGGTTATWPGDHATAERRPGPRTPLTGENCTVLFTDVAAFGAPVRSDEDRLIIRRAILNMTSAALRPTWDQCLWEDRGDGLLVVVPPSVPTGHVVEDLLSILPDALKWHNHVYGPSVQIQLRAALDVGPVESDNLGVSGQAIIYAARLLEAPELKKEISRTGANLGLIVSDFIYDMSIRQKCLNDPAAYTDVEVSVKEARLRAWMRLVDPKPIPPECLGRVSE